MGRDKNDIYRVRVCVESFRATSSTDIFKTVHLLVPAHWKASLEGLMSDIPYVSVLNEVDILSAAERAAFLTIPGWYKQQILKLSANRLSSAPAFVTLDSDVLNARRLTSGDIFSGEKVFFQPDRQRPEWVAGSCAVLDIPRVTPPTMGVTPAFLSAQGLSVVQKSLDATFGSWIAGLTEVIAKGGSWTEYMLYQGMLQKHGLWEELHCPRAPEEPIYKGFWQKTEPSAEVVETALRLSPMFLVVQSLNRNWQELHSHLAQHGIFSYGDLPETFIARAKEQFDLVTKAGGTEGGD